MDEPKLHEPNAEACARGYLRGAVVRWTGSYPKGGIGIVVGHDSDGDPWISIDDTEPEAILSRSSRLSLERPAEPAPAPVESMRAELGRRGYWLGSTEMLEQAHRVTGGDTARAVDLLLLILR